MKRLFCIEAKNGLGRLLTRPFLATSRELNEARRPHTCSRPCAFEGKNKNRKKNHDIPPHPKHTTTSTAARQPRPPRDGVRGNTSHALAHTRPLPEIGVCRIYFNSSIWSTVRMRVSAHCADAFLNVSFSGFYRTGVRRLRPVRRQRTLCGIRIK